MQDVTELKEAENNLIKATAQWRATFDSIADPVIIVDNDFRIVRVNRAAASPHGPSHEKVPGNYCYTLVCHADGPPVACPHAKMLETKERVRLRPTLIPQENGSSSPLIPYSMSQATWWGPCK